MPNCHICGKSAHAMLCVCGECAKPSKPTNADNVRAMSDEELAEWLTQESEEHAYIQCSRCVCGKPGMCTEDTVCARGVLSWLRQPAEEDVR